MKMPGLCRAFSWALPPASTRKVTGQTGESAHRPPAYQGMCVTWTGDGLSGRDAGRQVHGRPTRPERWGTPRLPGKARCECISVNGPMEGMAANAITTKGHRPVQTPGRHEDRRPPRQSAGRATPSEPGDGNLSPEGLPFSTLAWPRLRRPVPPPERRGSAMCGAANPRL